MLSNGIPVERKFSANLSESFPDRWEKVLGLWERKKDNWERVLRLWERIIVVWERLLSLWERIIAGYISSKVSRNEL